MQNISSRATSIRQFDDLENALNHTPDLYQSDNQQIMDSLALNLTERYKESKQPQESGLRRAIEYSRAVVHGMSKENIRFANALRKLSITLLTAAQYNPDKPEYLYDFIEAAEEGNKVVLPTAYG